MDTTPSNTDAVVFLPIPQPSHEPNSGSFDSVFEILADMVETALSGQGGVTER